MALPGVHARERVRCGGTTWLAPRAEAPNLTEPETREALSRLEPLWDELFPAEQARIVRALVERAEVGPAGADIRVRVGGAENGGGAGAGRRRSGPPDAG